MSIATPPSSSLSPHPPAPRTGRTWALSLALAWRDFLHEWRISACHILALAAVLAPLLILFGLKSGIIVTMRERLLADPRNLEVVIVGSHQLEPAWFRTMATRPEVGFLLPRTRSLAATLDVLAPSGRSLAGVEMVPTTSGDPLLDRAMPLPAGAGEVLLSHTAARQLGVAVGDTLTAVVARRKNEERQVARLPLRVVGIVPEAAFSRDALFVTLDLLVATEEFRDGLASTLPVGSGAAAADRERAYASARLFARGLDDVGPLADRLREAGIEVRTRAADIEMVKAIDRVLTLIVSVIAAIGITGYLLSLAASLWANVDRKRRELATMRLIGFPTASVVSFPATQALLVAAAGTALAFAAYGGVSAIFNRALAANLMRDEFVCRLMPADMAVAALGTLCLALVASAIGGFRASRIDPTESLREA